jgi:hypothetical protein
MVCIPSNSWTLQSSKINRQQYMLYPEHIQMHSWIAVFWEVTPRGSCKNCRFEGFLRSMLLLVISPMFLVHWFFSPDDEGDTFFLNFGFYKSLMASSQKMYCISSVFKTSMRRIQNIVNIQHTDNNKYIKFKVLNIIIKIKLKFKFKIKSTINKQLWARKSQDKTIQITEYEINWESMSRTTMYIQNNHK